MCHQVRAQTGLSKVHHTSYTFEVVGLRSVRFVFVTGCALHLFCDVTGDQVLSLCHLYCQQGMQSSYYPSQRVHLVSKVVDHPAQCLCRIDIVCYHRHVLGPHYCARPQLGLPQIEDPLYLIKIVSLLLRYREEQLLLWWRVQDVTPQSELRGQLGQGEGNRCAEGRFGELSRYLSI